jgi:hypothetical protein
VRVVVLVVGELNPPGQRGERLGLRLGGRTGAPVRLARALGVRALVVVVPPGGEVPPGPSPEPELEMEGPPQL